MAIIIIASFSVLLFVSSFIKVIENRPKVVSFIFKIAVVGWFITMTALNRFPSDYSYCMIVVMMIFGMIYTSSKGFLHFFLLTLAVLLVLIFFISNPIVHMVTYLMLYCASGALTYIILRSKDRAQAELQKAQINTQAIFHSSVGFFFFLDSNYNLISFNKFAQDIFHTEMKIELKTGTSIFNYFPPETHQHFRETLGKCMKGEVIRNEKYVEFPNGPAVWVENTFVPVYDDQHGFLGISFQTVRINERKIAELALKESEERFSQITENINDGFWIGTKDEFLYINKAFEEIWGIHKEELYNNPALLSESIYPADLEMLKNKHPEARSESDMTDEQYRIIRPDGEIRWVWARRFPVFDAAGELYRTAGIVTDISERKKFDYELQQSEKRFKEMADTLPLLVYETNEKGDITYYNKAGFSYTGYTTEDFEKGLTLPMMFPPGEMERAIENAKRVMAGENIGAIEYKLKRKDGTLYPALINTVPIIRGNKVVGRRGVVTDITELKKAEDKIKASLTEKEILLNEIHHRVKNNLQIISSMLRLQSANITDSREKSIFSDAQNRILSMSLVHEKLYKAKNFSSINFSEYLKELVNSISNSYSLSNEKVKVAVKAENIFINIDTMIPLGLIINELLTNCYKHAFPENKKGFIEIVFKRLDDKQLLLDIKDNGVGISKDLDIENIQSLGLKLVKILADQISGDLHIENSNGSSFRITFTEIGKNN